MDALFILSSSVELLVKRSYKGQLDPSWVRIATETIQKRVASSIKAENNLESTVTSSSSSRDAIVYPEHTAKISVAHGLKNGALRGHSDATTTAAFDEAAQFAHVIVQHNDLFFVAFVTEAFPSGYVLELLARLAVSLEHYFAMCGNSGLSSSSTSSGPLYTQTETPASLSSRKLTQKTVEENYATFVVLLEEMLDFGLPAMLEPNGLTLLVPPKTADIISLTLKQFIAPAKSFLTDLIQNNALLGAKDVAPYSGSNSSKSGNHNTASRGIVSNVLRLSDYGGCTSPGDGMGTGSGIGAGSGILGAGSALWWRQGIVNTYPKGMTAATLSSTLVSAAGVEFCLLERLNCVVSQRHDPPTLISATLSGEGHYTSYISGIPSCKILIKNPSILETNRACVTFHPSVNLQKWKEEKIIAFVPPNGSFTLFRYSLAPATLCPPLTIQAQFSFPQPTALAAPNVPPKLESGPRCTTTKTNREEGGLFGRFELQLAPNPNFGAVRGSCGSNERITLEDVTINIQLPPSIVSLTTVECPSGSLKYFSTESRLQWSFSRLPLSFQTPSQLRCEGTLNVASPVSTESSSVLLSSKAPSLTLTTTKDFHPVAILRFSMTNWLISTLTLESMEVTCNSQNSTASMQSTATHVNGVVEYRL